MHALVRMDAPNEDQVLTTTPPLGIEREINPVVDRSKVVERGRAIGIADGNEVSVAVLLIHLHDFGRREAVDGGQHWSLDQARVAERHKVIVAMNQVELRRMLKRLGNVQVFGYLGIKRTIFFVPLLDNGMQARPCNRIPGCKEGHVPSSGYEALGDIAGHRLPGSI